jgi:hypothetical protein
MFSYDGMPERQADSNEPKLSFADLQIETGKDPEVVQFSRAVDATNDAIANISLHIERIYAQAAKSHPNGLAGFLADHARHYPEVQSV